MIQVEGTHITIPQGDTGTLNINVVTSADMTNAIGVFTVKSIPSMSAQKLIEKRSTFVNKQISYLFGSDETEAIRPGDYYWDLRILGMGGTVDTPSREPMVFSISPVVGDNE